MTEQEWKDFTKAKAENLISQRDDTLARIEVSDTQRANIAKARNDAIAARDKAIIERDAAVTEKTALEAQVAALKTELASTQSQVLTLTAQRTEDAKATQALEDRLNHQIERVQERLAEMAAKHDQAHDRAERIDAIRDSLVIQNQEREQRIDALRKKIEEMSAHPDVIAQKAERARLRKEQAARDLAEADAALKEFESV